MRHTQSFSIRSHRNVILEPKYYALVAPPPPAVHKYPISRKQRAAAHLADEGGAIGAAEALGARIVRQRVNIDGAVHRHLPKEHQSVV